MFGTALVGASMMSVACVAEESAGAAGSSGSAGNSAGSGGSTAGTGGSAAGTAGTGGTTAGSGGTAAGAGGTTGGSGGSTGGSGGSTAGSGGTTGGSGGSTAGAGGTAAGAGGSTAGSGGTAAGAAGAPAITCTAGSFQCTGQVLEECNAAGTAVTTKATCTATETCDATMGKCVPFACTPGAYRCNGNDLEKCNAGGTAYAVDKACTATESCNAADAKCDTPTQPDPQKGYVRFAQLVPSAGQTAYDVCIRPAGSTNWDTSASGDATQIFKDNGDPGEFYYPTISTYFEFPMAGAYEFRFVAGNAANCDVPSPKLPGGVDGFYALTVPAGEVYTLVVYDKDATGKEKDLDIVAFANQAPVSGKATVTWANAMTNVPALDFGSVVGNQFTDMQASVAKKSSTISTHDPVSARIGSIRSDDLNNKIHSITATDVDLAGGGVYTTFAFGVNEFAFGKLRPGIVVCNDIGTGTVVGSNTIASGCVYSAP